MSTSRHNVVGNGISRQDMNRRKALFAGHDEAGYNWGRVTSLLGTWNLKGVEAFVRLRKLFTELANGYLAQDIDALNCPGFLRGSLFKTYAAFSRLFICA